jgi:hypothetical protein
VNALLLDLGVILRGWRRAPGAAALSVTLPALGVGVATGLLTGWIR